MKSSYPSITTYIKTFPKEVQLNLEKIRQVIQKNAPRAVEMISYGIPTFDLDGVHLVHFAAFKKHISFFPTSSPIIAFKRELADYKISKERFNFCYISRFLMT